MRDPRSYAERWRAAVAGWKLNTRLQRALVRSARLEGSRVPIASQGVLFLLGLLCAIQCGLLILAAWDLVRVALPVDPGCGWTCWRAENPTVALVTDIKWGAWIGGGTLMLLGMRPSLSGRIKVQGSEEDAEREVFSRLAMLEEREKMSKFTPPGLKSKNKRL